jgi:hypothetical protein
VTFHEISAEAARKSIDFMGQSFAYKGITYRGIINELTAEQQLQIGGNRDSFAASVYVRKNGFPVPVIGDRITVSGVERYIASIASDPISYTLTLEDLTQ